MVFGSLVKQNAALKTMFYLLFVVVVYLTVKDGTGRLARLVEA